MSESLKKISQRNFTQGVAASAQDFAQPKNSIPRVSNLLLTRRGGLLTCDGSQVITAYQGVIQPISANLGPITETFLYQPTGFPNAYYAIMKDFNTHLGAPVGLVAADGGAAGNLSAGTYQWQVTAIDGAGGETSGSNNQSVVLAANHKGNLNWTAVNFATGYNVYRTVANGSTKFLVNPTPITTNSYVDNIADASLGTATLPTTDTTQVSQFIKMTEPSFSAANIVKTFPADLPVVQDGTGGGAGGGIGGTGAKPSSGQQPPTPAGGIAGTISVAPQIVQFANNMILALGNGYPPQQSDGTTPNTIALTNTFTASYPARTNSTAQAIGDLIAVAGVLYKATQGGTTAAGPPVFNTTKGAITADGSVIWQSQGPISSVPAPPGAAHAIVYAGCLWVFNTSPTNTASGLDGPSALRMSDLNNPNSWNPLNTAFLDKDDGSQGMGLAVFTIAEAGISPTGSLVAFKEFSTFQVIGIFGAADFSIQRAQTDLGCVSPRSIQFVPGFGIMRMTHLGIAVFDGVRDRIVSEQIRPYIFGGLPDIQPLDWNFIWAAKGALTANPPMYCCAIPTYIPESTLTGPVVSAVTVAATAGPNVAGTGTSTGSGEVWTNPGNVSSAVAYAQQNYSSTGPLPLQSLDATNFAFAVAPAGIFTGITVTLESFMGLFNLPTTLQIQLLKNGTPVGDVKTASLTTANQTYTLGGAADLWGASWIGSDFNSSAFGVRITAVTASHSFDLNLRNVQITVNGSLTLPDGNYYFKVVKYKTNGTRTITAEQGPFALGPGTGKGFEVDVPAPQTGDLKYRVYFGNGGPTSENQYLEFPATSPTFVASSPGLAGFPTSSNGELTRLLCFDLVLKAWVVVDLPFSIFTFKQYRSPGTIPITTMSGFYDGAFRRWQMGDDNWDAGSLDPAIHFGMRSAEVFGQNASDRVYFRRISVRGVGDPTGLTATYTTNGLNGTSRATQNFNVQQFATGEFVAYTDIGLTAVDAYVFLSGVASEQVEVDSIDWSYVAKPVGGLVVAG